MSVPRMISAVKALIFTGTAAVPAALAVVRMSVPRPVVNSACGICCYQFHPRPAWNRNRIYCDSTNP
jgi:hypothetical protein